MVNDPKTNLFIVIESNGFLKLKVYQNIIILLTNLHNSHLLIKNNILEYKDSKR